jgi:hypothetical protein
MPSLASSSESDYALHLTRNLRLTCRVIAAELSAFFFGHNRLSINYCCRGSLQSLRNLALCSLHSLTYLTLVLKGTREITRYGWPYQKDERRLPNPSCRIKPLTASSHLDQGLIAEWQCTANSIFKHIEPSGCQLHLICDVENAELAKQVLEPLLDITTFSDLSIRLNLQPDTKLSQIATDTATRGSGKPFRG